MKIESVEVSKAENDGEKETPPATASNQSSQQAKAAFLEDEQQIVVSVRDIKQRLKLIGNDVAVVRPVPLRRSSATDCRQIAPPVASRSKVNVQTANEDTKNEVHSENRPLMFGRSVSDGHDVKKAFEYEEDMTVVSASDVASSSLKRPMSVLDMALRFGETNQQQKVDTSPPLAPAMSPARPPRKKDSTSSNLQLSQQQRRWISGSSSGCDDEGFHDDAIVPSAVASSPGASEISCLSDIDCGSSNSNADSNRQSPETTARSISSISNASAMSSGNNLLEDSTTDPDLLLTAVVAAAPLPPGPPPKKPPRTFAHDLYVRSKSATNSADDSADSRQVKNPRRPRSPPPNPPRKFSAPATVDSGEKTSLPCLSNLVTSPEETTPRTTRAMTLGRDAVPPACAGSRPLPNASKAVMKRCRSDEHIYAVPYAVCNTGKNPVSRLLSPIYAEIEDNSDGDYDDPRRLERPPTNATQKDLHYSCVPVVKHNGATVVVVNPSRSVETPPPPPPLPVSGPVSLSCADGTVSTVVVTGDPLSSPRPVSKKVSLKRRPPVNNKSWARRCLEKAANRADGIQPAVAGVGRNNSDLSLDTSSASPDGHWGSCIREVNLSGDHDDSCRTRSASVGVEYKPLSTFRSKSVDSEASSPVISATLRIDTKRVSDDRPTRLRSNSGNVIMSEVNPSHRRIAQTRRAILKESSSSLGKSDDKRPPLPPQSKDRFSGLNTILQSLMEKAKRRCHFTKTPSSNKLSVLPSSGSPPVTPASSGKKNINLRGSASSPLLMNPGSRRGSSNVNESRTPSTSSSGAEDSDITNDDDEDSEKEDDAGISSPFSFSEIRERWKERERVIENRKSYVRRVSSTVSSVYRKNLLTGCHNRVFDCVLVVGLFHDVRRDVYKPFVRKAFPPDASYPENIAMFCFPDACTWRGKSGAGPVGDDLCRNTSTCNSYSIVLTSEKGERTFGYCRRIVPSANERVEFGAGSGNPLPLAYCLLSKIRAHGFYDKFMSAMISCHGSPDTQMQTFLTLVGRKAMPSPGQSLSLPIVGTGLQAGSPDVGRASSGDGRSPSSPSIARALDERLEESDLAVLIGTIDHSLLMKIFGAVLLERKILLASTSMKKLSSCIQGLSGLLYPFSWEHVLVPILPLILKDVVTAPSPFLIGLLLPANMQPGADFTRDLFVSDDLSTEGLMIIDVDKNRLVKSVGDESTILPRKIRKCLQTTLSFVSELTEPGDPARNVLISEVFISTFVELCGHYKNHIVPGPDGKRVFQSDAFLASSKNASSRLFLSWFVETAMFSIFIDNRILQNGARDNDLFDYRVLEQQSDGGGKSIFKIMKQFSKTVKSDKWKDWKASTQAQSATAVS